MDRVYRVLVEFCWVAGVLGLVVAVVVRFLPSVAEGIAISPRGALIFASALFLCTLATREMELRTK